MNELEAFACVWAIERWHRYLCGIRFTLRSDHKNLGLFSNANGLSKIKSLRLTRWAERIVQYDFTLEYLPGKENADTDLLSRFTYVVPNDVRVASLWRNPCTISLP